jgi:pimeloyl-ACP methyl ester carboxylesterase
MPAGEEFDIVVGSCRLHAERWGSESAPLVLGLPGLTGNLKHFGLLGERLGSDTLQLVALDLRGRGKSVSTPPGSYGWENHAFDVLGVASELGFDRFTVIGQSMGGSVAMKAAELKRGRLSAVVLVDVAGRVDRGVAAPIAASISRLGRVYDSADHYLEAVRSLGLIDRWNEYWDGAYRYDARAVDGGVGPRTNVEAVREDRAYTATQHPYGRWTHLIMPTLLVRATRELLPGAGLVVPADDRERFLREVPHAVVVDVDANHLTINTHADTAAAVRNFLARKASP